MTGSPSRFDLFKACGLAMAEMLFSELLLPTGAYKLLIYCLYKLVLSIFFKLSGLRRLVTLLSTQVVSLKPAPLLLDLLLPLTNGVSFCDSNLLIWAAYRTELKEDCMVKPSTIFCKRQTPVLNLAFECLWFNSRTLLKAVSAIFLTEMLYCHFRKASFILCFIIFLNRFCVLSKEVARNLSLAFFSIEY